MEKVTADQVKEAVKEAGTTKWMLRRCDACGAEINLIFSGDAVSYDENCTHASRHLASTEETWDGVADILNAQTPAFREMMWSQMLGGVRANA